MRGHKVSCLIASYLNQYNTLASFTKLKLRKYIYIILFRSNVKCQGHVSNKYRVMHYDHDLTNMSNNTAEIRHQTTINLLSAQT